MGVGGFFKSIFRIRKKTRHFHVTVTFKTSLSENTGSAWLLSSEPMSVDDTWCYNFRNILKYKVLHVSFIDQSDKITKKTYKCTMQDTNRLIFINESRVPEEYGKILMTVPKIERVGNKKFIVMAEVGDFEKALNGAYKDFSLIGKTVSFDIKYKRELIQEEE